MSQSTLWIRQGSLIQEELSLMLVIVYQRLRFLVQPIALGLALSLTLNLGEKNLRLLNNL